VVATGPRAERDIWRWLFDIDLVGRIQADRVPVPPPLFHVLAEPRRLGLTVLDGLWVRVVDLPAALAGRRYAAEGRLVIEVDDAFCPWNAGRWAIEPAAPDPTDAGGATRPAHVARTDRPADLALDASSLGAVYLGGTLFRELAAAGRVAELTPGSVRLADAMFASDRTPWCSTMF
jgi:predicted acetyltransferase